MSGFIGTIYDSCDQQELDAVTTILGTGTAVDGFELVKNNGTTDAIDLDRLRADWETFIATGDTAANVNPVIAKSWRRCRNHGLNPQAGALKTIDKSHLQFILQENETIIEIARPVMRSILELVQRSHFRFVLTDASGCVLEAISDGNLSLYGREPLVELGTMLGEIEVGTNAMGVALAYNTPIQISGPEHYCARYHDWTCSAAPIHGLRGEVVGCVGMSGVCEDFHPHTLGLVMTAALVIETQILSKYHVKLMQISLDNNSDCIVVLDKEFRPVLANPSACRLLEMKKEEVEAVSDFRDYLPDLDWAAIQRDDPGEVTTTNDTRLVAREGERLCSIVVTPMHSGMRRSYSLTLKRMDQIIRSVSLLGGNRSSYTFDDILAHSAVMQKTVTLARRYARYNGVVLIQGESGTGKELFAQAIHSASDRADKPFVTINCATLPRELVESELFGYEKGAFTGANSEGNMGKFELADQGTVFLDEIGELPLEFQAKLLRIVETHKVRRLGGNTEKKLDVRIIAATNRNLRREVMEGGFRADLFFRLQVMQLSIPPLRERREEIILCAQKFLDHFNRRYPDQRKQMSERFKAGLMRHSWPGNVRELQNSIERAFYSCSSDTLCKREIEAVFEHKSSSISAPLTKKEQQQRQRIEDALHECHGNVRRMAERVGISLATVYRLIKKFDIDPKFYRD